jgi:hypothetical protein
MGAEEISWALTFHTCIPLQRITAVIKERENLKGSRLSEKVISKSQKRAKIRLIPNHTKKNQ